ncbi:kallikrein-1-like [Leptidea sinapis]|uniref:kallikrein-1-like n=1 Tax=Leptidea sinapis TaxID=189913 RepID=UPI002126042A|nr:kallikrein-1-like [Leptidea sinapis]
MKVALALIFIFAAVQSRSVQPLEEGTSAPWLVHLRFARSTGGGLLESCVGVLINQSWVATTGSCGRDVTFVWIRYNAQRVIQPELISETSQVRVHPAYNPQTGENDIALISLNRVIPLSDTIAVASLADEAADVPETSTLCGYGENADGGPGDELSCFAVSLEADGDIIVASSEDGAATGYDLGSPLVDNDALLGILVRAGDNDNAGVFLKTAQFAEWIEEVTAAEPAIDFHEVQVAEF